MTFLSRGFKNLQWYSMTQKAVKSLVSRLFYNLFRKLAGPQLTRFRAILQKGSPPGSHPGNTHEVVRIPFVQFIKVVCRLSDRWVWAGVPVVIHSNLKYV